MEKMHGSGNQKMEAEMTLFNMPPPGKIFVFPPYNWVPQS